MKKKLEKEYEYFKNQIDLLISKYLGKYIVIKNKEVIGSYDDQIIAIKETLKKHKIGTFLVQRCIKMNDTNIPTFYSRVVFK